MLKDLELEEEWDVEVRFPLEIGVLNWHAAG